MQHRVSGTQGCPSLQKSELALANAAKHTRWRHCRSAVPSPAAFMPPCLRSTAWHCPDRRWPMGGRGPIDLPQGSRPNPPTRHRAASRDGGMSGPSVSGRQEWSSVSQFRGRFCPVSTVDARHASTRPGDSEMQWPSAKTRSRFLPPDWWPPSPEPPSPMAPHQGPCPQPLAGHLIAVSVLPV